MAALEYGSAGEWPSGDRGCKIRIWIAETVSEVSGDRAASPPTTTARWCVTYVTACPILEEIDPCR
jgi:hypothetical protein